MRHRFPGALRFIAFATFCWVGFVRSLAQEASNAVAPESGPTYVLRVNPRWAGSVNRVLLRVAQPNELTVPAGLTPGDLVRRLCAGHEADAPALIENAPGKIRLFPCVHIRTDVEVKVRPGNTLEGIAVNYGLPAAAGPQLKVVRENDPRPVSAEALQSGDIVKIPEVPVWTTIAVNPRLIRDRTSLVEAIGTAVNCKQGDMDNCLHSRGIYVLQGARAAPRPEPPPPAKDVPRQDVPQLPEPVKQEAWLQAWEPRRALAVFTTLSAALPANGLTSTTVPVAASQWPYDLDLLAAIFQDLHDPLPARGIVGIADGGLADAGGGPLPLDLFDQSQEERPDYENDVIGAGVKRTVNDLVATGDVSLCAGAVDPPFSMWDPEKLALASHGSVVASLAGALPLRQRHPNLSKLLPNLVFFRMLQKVCDPQTSFGPDEGAMAIAFDYLKERAGIIAIPYMFTSSGKSSFVTAMKEALLRDERLLVLPSGDLPPGDLDARPYSPQRLGNNDSGIFTANRTIVVGSATRQLTTASYSNFGDRTVSLYAPGEPEGALTIAGADASAFGPATSWAAPQVALAAAILRSFGYTEARDIKDRLAAATWPLTGAQGSRIGVVDLVKVAAVRHHAVEVIETGTDGAPVRKTYVGKLHERLQDLTICAGFGLSETRVHAVRLDGNGPDRRARLYKKNDFEEAGQFEGRRKIQEIPSCRSQGEIHLNALLAGQKVFPLSAVTQIQFPWVPRR